MESADLQSAAEEELVRQTQAGSFAAFEELVRRFEGRIFAFAAGACRDAAAAREITQDTFVRAFQAIARCDATRPFGPWLFTIARRQCADRRRTPCSLPLEAAPEPVCEENPASELAGREARRDLWALARDRLPAAQFQALWLKYAEDQTVAQIAAVLGKTQVHVKVLLFRARRTLARELSRPGAGLPARTTVLRPAAGLNPLLPERPL